MLSELIPQIAGLDQREYKYNPRPSSAGCEHCIRQQVYHALGYIPKPRPGRSILTMDDSSWHEELSSDWINKTIYKLHSSQMGVNCLKLKNNSFLKNGYKCKICKQDVPTQTLHGHIDGILQEPTGFEHLYEHKAINHFTFQAYETGDLVPYNYITQVVLYYNSLIELLNKDLSYSILFIKNKNTAQYMEYHIEYDSQTDIAKIEIYRVEYNDDGFPVLKLVREAFAEKIIAGVINQFETVDKCVAEKRLPKRQYNIDSWHCDYCAYNIYCWADYDKEIINRKEAVDISNIIDKIDNFFKLDKQVKDCSKQADILKDEIKLLMINEQAHTGIAGQYMVTLSQQERATLDKKLIPPEILNQATKINKIETLKIKEIKSKGDK